MEGVSILAAAAAQQVPASVVCRGGTPSVAVTRIIRAAASVGWNIAVSSDFEPRGLHGAITLLRHLQSAGQPWRLTAAEYLAAPAEGEPFSPGQVPHTPWDPALADAMRQRRERVSEEARIASLLADLQAPSTVRSSRASGNSRDPSTPKNLTPGTTSPPRWPSRAGLLTPRPSLTTQVGTRLVSTAGADI